MITYYTVYGLLLISTLFELSTFRIKKVVVIAWCIFFTLFSGLRWGVGPDWDSYLDIFLASDFTNIFSFDRYGNGELMEYGYVFLNAITKNVFGEYFAFNLLISGFVQFSNYYACKLFAPKIPIILYAFLIIFGGIFPARGSLAGAIAFWGYKYIKEQNLLKFLIVLALTCSIHMKCIIFLPCYWIGRIRLKWYVFYIIYLATVALYVQFQQQIALIATFFDSSSMGEKFLKYTENETEGFSGISYLGVALNLFLISIYLFLRKKKIFSDEMWMNALLNMYLISMCIYALFSEGMGDLARLATLFILPQSLLLSLAIGYFSHKRILILKSGAITFFILYYIYRIVQATSGYFFIDAYVPYRTIFD